MKLRDQASCQLSTVCHGAETLLSMMAKMLDLSSPVDIMMLEILSSLDSQWLDL